MQQHGELPNMTVGWDVFKLKSGNYPSTMIQAVGILSGEKGMASWSLQRWCLGDSVASTKSSPKVYFQPHWCCVCAFYFLYETLNSPLVSQEEEQGLPFPNRHLLLSNCSPHWGLASLPQICPSHNYMSTSHMECGWIWYTQRVYTSQKWYN